MEDRNGWAVALSPDGVSISFAGNADSIMYDVSNSEVLEMLHARLSEIPKRMMLVTFGILHICRWRRICMRKGGLEYGGNLDSRLEERLLTIPLSLPGSQRICTSGPYLLPSLTLFCDVPDHISQALLSRQRIRTHRFMVHLMINMHEAPIHIGQRLDLILKILSDIVSPPEGHLGREDNVEFNKVLWPRMIDLDSVDRLDLGRECHCLIVSFADRATD